MTGSILAAGVVWLGVLATSHDDYYLYDAVSYWENMTRAGSGAIAFFVVGMAIAGGFALTCLARGLLPKRFAFALPIPLVLVAYAVAFWMAWVPLVGGH